MQAAEQRLGGGKSSTPPPQHCGPISAHSFNVMPSYSELVETMLVRIEYNFDTRTFACTCHPR